MLSNQFQENKNKALKNNNLIKKSKPTQKKNYKLPITSSYTDSNHNQKPLLEIKLSGISLTILNSQITSKELFPFNNMLNSKNQLKELLIMLNKTLLYTLYTITDSTWPEPQLNYQLKTTKITQFLSQKIFSKTKVLPKLLLKNQMPASTLTLMPVLSEIKLLKTQFNSSPKLTLNYSKTKKPMPVF